MDIQNPFKPAAQVATCMAILVCGGTAAAEAGCKITGPRRLGDSGPERHAALDALAKLRRAVTLSASEGEPVTSEVIWEHSSKHRLPKS